MILYFYGQDLQINEHHDWIDQEYYSQLKNFYRELLQRSISSSKNLLTKLLICWTKNDIICRYFFQSFFLMLSLLRTSRTNLFLANQTKNFPNIYLFLLFSIESFNLQIKSERSSQFRRKGSNSQSILITSLGSTWNPNLRQCKQQKCYITGKYLCSKAYFFNLFMVSPYLQRKEFFLVSVIEMKGQKSQGGGIRSY